MKQLFRMLLIVLLSTAFILPGESSAASYKDTKGHWAQPEINYLSSKGIISGYTNGTFKPDTAVTRGQTAIMLVRALNLSLANRPAPSYTDVSRKHGAYQYIAAVADEGLFPKGKTFAPDKPLTREEMARVITNAYKLTGKKNVVFKDVPVTYWAHPYISLVAENGIAAGFSNGKFQPKSAVTRAQFSVFMSRSLDDKFKVTPPAPAQKPAPVLMKDITFNMNYNQVRTRETRPLLYGEYDGGDGILAYDVTKFGYFAELFYLFEGNKLNFAGYDFLPYQEDYHSIYEIYSIHQELQAQAVREFGYDFYYEDNSYIDVELVTVWPKNGYTIVLAVDDIDYYTTALIGYIPNSFRSAASVDSSSLQPMLDQLRSMKKAREKK